MKIKKNIQLKEYSTFKIGGPSKYFCEIGELKDLEEAVNWSKKNKQRIFVFGGGSNILFMDKGFDGLAAKLSNNSIEIKNQDDEQVVVEVGAGVKLSNLVKFSIENSLTGVEWAAGIPGTVGGAIRGNAGAFGGQMKDSVVNVTAVKIAKDLKKKEFNNKACEFDYRDSLFKKDKDLVIWESEFKLKKGKKDEIQKTFNEIIQKRKEKQPSLSEFPSAGSIFKNPVVKEAIRRQFEEDKNIECHSDKVPAGWLIEQCDSKEKRIGDAMVSPLQANFIVNMGDAKAEDVLILISFIKMKVRNEQGIQLEEEIQIVI